MNAASPQALPDCRQNHPKVWVPCAGRLADRLGFRPTALYCGVGRADGGKQMSVAAAREIT
jgi:hypothetical protein